MRIFSLLLLTALTVTGCGGSGSSSDNSGGFNGDNTGNSGSGGNGVDDGGNTGGGSGGDTGGGSGGDTGGGSGGGVTPDPNDGTFAEQMLTAVNAARAVGRNCGTTFYPAAAPLTWDTKLEDAARVHSGNMANYNFFSHTGLDGKGVSQRVDDQGYSWSAVAENIAAGQQTIDIVMSKWLDSPGHCKNIMNSNYTQMGAASETNASSQYNIYWTQVFARPR
ncbi:hypothetical protein A3K86_16265 [Photobacterium jeanii]|uniref:SCP domain-containing protein n=1 Tax=Photobacterium jeanii TaxID=858640 RepID=A0A178K7A8_9GAMM|nr:CAP domain-containing protein [Photobacterium jeanii]OAN13210.1 hypothetical protein A3K86_16265 [Photobacterium jeanii]PST89361.1 CAP domain-containing protein [Photobacterium jeanii]